MLKIEHGRVDLLAKLTGGNEYLSNKRKLNIKHQSEKRDQNQSDTLKVIEQMHSACLSDH